MLADDSPPWHGPGCPQCGAELDVEPIADGLIVRVGYGCAVHGLVSVADPFEIH